ncbi:immediate early response 3-interacting protein 1 [Diaphorina citri]|uniref:Immediate early response 3-interacting protein 1 n=1 Tax=Diaphorina citri TaxID=121845 RepID=A0A1S3DGA5_DIACI|nr:immediate early response 3-interacting protein 1 [Diaphorina citri]KAI5704547.1 hypothetical protein M8J75_006508 [Diaphorina citri]KAI5737333.1 hypothetical protein M8J76_012440 [Diaphorina citri]KAI5742780.1 hypothetical protein M8J77_011298 [Diaphorina citri]
MFTLGSLLEAGILVLNAICILNEERFLSKFYSANPSVHGFGEQPSIKSQFINLIKSIRTVMRIPLIFVNILAITYKLILG